MKFNSIRKILPLLFETIASKKYIWEDVNNAFFHYCSPPTYMLFDKSLTFPLLVFSKGIAQCYHPGEFQLLLVIHRFNYGIYRVLHCSQALLVVIKLSNGLTRAMLMHTSALSSLDISAPISSVARLLLGHHCHSGNTFFSILLWSKQCFQQTWLWLSFANRQFVYFLTLWRLELLVGVATISQTNI